MLNIIIFILGCYGITMIIVQSKITKPLRMFFNKRIPSLYSLLSCMMCTGFWIGVIFSFLFNYSIATLIFPNIIDNIIGNISLIIFDGAFMSGCIWFLYLIQLNLQRYIKNEL